MRAPAPSAAPSDSSAVQQPKLHPLTIAAVTPETDDAITLTFHIPDTLIDTFAFRPGQYLTLEADIDGQKHRRAYSICAGLDDPLRVAIKRVDGGAFSGWAHANLRPGHTVHVLPPAGRFTLPLDPTSAKTYLAIAAGSGITPILSITKSVLAREPGSRVILLYGSRSTASILFREELETLKDRHIGRLGIVHVLSREQQDIPLLNGRLDGPRIAALLPALCPGTLPDLAFLCGPADLIGAATAALEHAGLPPGRILREHFATATQPARPAPRPALRQVSALTATIIADGLHTTIPVGATETVLDAALRAGLDLPWSCHAGMCSTCRARVTQGTVTMDVNYALEPWETQAGYVLTCQSRPSTPHVTIDYDHA